MADMKTFALLFPILGLSSGLLFAQKSEPRQSPPYVPESIKRGEPAQGPAKGKASVQDVSADDAEKLLKQHNGLVVLDMRTPDEFAAGHLKAAKNIDIMEDDSAKRRVEVDGRPVLVHCASRGRSAKAPKI